MEFIEKYARAEESWNNDGMQDDAGVDEVSEC